MLGTPLPVTLRSPDNKLGLARYQTLVEADFLTWQAEYIRHGAGGGNEFGKSSSFMKAEPTPEHNFEAGVVKAIWRKGDTLLVDLAFAAELNTIYGAPATARLNYTATAYDSPVHDSPAYGGPCA